MAPCTPWRWIRTCLGLAPSTGSPTPSASSCSRVLKYAVEAGVIWLVAGRRLSPSSSSAPRSWWTMWSDYAIHAIHRRVLEHVERLSEADAA